MRRVVSYIRVSTDRPTEGGLGIEDQREAVARFAEAEGWNVLAEHVELETCDNSDTLDQRPALAAALVQARNLNAALVVAKLCRISNNATFISSLMAQRVTFIVVERDADTQPFMLNAYTALAERERHVISVRTRAALAARKAQGAMLGNRTNLGEARTKSAAVSRAGAEVFAANVLPVVHEIQASGTTTLRAIAQALNARGIRTARGGEWHHPSVRNLLARDASAESRSAGTFRQF